MLTVGSLFAGIGGFDLGLERAGMRVAWQSEIDPYASAVLRKHWPSVPNHGDIRSIRAGSVESVDVICGGFPCQPFSHAGKRGGESDDRYLWPEMLRVIDELRPAYVIGENVAGIISMALDQVLSDLEAIGYTTRPLVIPAVAVDAPHRRDRVWIIAYASSEGRRQELRGAYGDESADAGRAAEQMHVVSGDGAIWYVAHANERRMYRDCADAEDGRAVSAQGLERVIRGGDGGANVAHAERGGQPGQGQPVHAECPAQAITREAIDAFHGRGREQWGVEPDVGRVANGVPSRVDRLRCLGNAIVPQIAEVIGRAIIDADMRAAA